MLLRAASHGRTGGAPSPYGTRLFSASNGVGGKTHQELISQPISQIRVGLSEKCCSHLRTLAVGRRGASIVPDAVDFSTMNGKPDLFIDEVVHKGLVEVNEEGTKAAGATAVAPRPMAGPPTSVVEFRADHPFLFLIRDNQTGSILFFGRIVDPTK